MEQSSFYTAMCETLRIETCVQVEAEYRPTGQFNNLILCFEGYY